MPVNSMAEFWKLAVDSRLLALPQCQQLLPAFEAAYPSCMNGVGAPQLLADWLVSVQAISRYQANVLLTGRPGPFVYGDYQVYERLEQGPLTGLFRAFHMPTRHPVLLQFATGTITQDAVQWSYVASRVQRCLSEPQLHHHRCYEAVDLGHYKFFVSEELNGETVADLLARTGRLAPTAACFLARQAALGLAHLQRWSLAHGDVRPANLWVESTGRLLLLSDPAQLPMAWSPSHDDAAGVWQQRADFIAPEYGAGNRLPDAASDIYSLGCTIYQLLTGQPPFPGGDWSTKVRRHQGEVPASLAAWGVPQQLEQLLAYLLAKDPAVRISSAATVADHLAAYVDPQALAQLTAAPAPTLPLYEQYLAQRYGGSTGGAAAVPPTPQFPVTSPAPEPTPAPTQVSPAPTPVAPTPTRVASAPTQAAPAATAANPASATASAPAPARTTKSAAAATKAVNVATAAAATAAPATKAAANTPLTGIPPLAPTVTRATKHSTPQNNQKLLLIGAGAVGVVIVGLLAAMFLGGGPSPTKVEDDSVAQADPAADSQTSSDTEASSTAVPGTNSPSGKASETQPPGTDKTGKSTNKTAAEKTAAEKTGAAKTAAEKNAAEKTAGAKNSTGKTATGKTPAGNSGNTTESKPSSDGPAVRQEVIADNGQLLWASPTQGPAVELDFVPPGGQLFLIVRPAEMLATTEGPRVLRGLGPNVELAIKEWETAAGVRLADIRQLILTLHDNGEEFPRSSLVVHLNESVPVEDLTARWGNAQPLGDAESRLFKNASWTYYVPADSDGRVFVMGATEDVEKVAKETKGAPPALRREIDKLRRVTDAQRHVSLLLAPNYLSSNLFRDGRKYYFGDGKKAREPLDWFLKDELQALLFSLHCDHDSFWELRLATNIGKEKLQLATELRDRLAEVPDQALDYIATIGSNPYWERVRLLYPNMIRMLHKMTRVGVEEDMAVVNCVLPPSAAHNLVFGSEMVLASTPGALPVANTPTASSKYTPATMTLDDVVNKFETTLMFEAQSLEFALQDIAKDVNESLKGLPFEFKIKILGDDLQLDGITRNQTIRDFQQKGKTVGEVLTAMVRKANPVTTVKEASEKDQKLIWVLDKDPADPAKTIVLVTTRAAADKRKYQLPKPFQLKE
ncbi:MAG: protein kinase domain-containing protein [Planctomycetota bacterium]